MILWLNGSFGSGKSSVAEAIHSKIEKSFIYDPEQVGYFLWENFPDEMKRKDDFQHMVIWREFNYKILKQIYDNYKGLIIVPMTIYIKQYYDEIIGCLLNNNIDVRHYILSATKQTIINRLIKRGSSEDGWEAQHIDGCINAFETIITKEKIITDNKNIDEIVSEIINLSLLIS